MKGAPVGRGVSGMAFIGLARLTLEVAFVKLIESMFDINLQARARSSG